MTIYFIIFSLTTHYNYILTNKRVIDGIYVTLYVVLLRVEVFNSSLTIPPAVASGMGREIGKVVPGEGAG